MRYHARRKRTDMLGVFYRDKRLIGGIDSCPYVSEELCHKERLHLSQIALVVRWKSMGTNYRKSTESTELKMQWAASGHDPITGDTCAQLQPPLVGTLPKGPSWQEKCSSQDVDKMSSWLLRTLGFHSYAWEGNIGAGPTCLPSGLLSPPTSCPTSSAAANCSRHELTRVLSVWGLHARQSHVCCITSDLKTAEHSERPPKMCCATSSITRTPTITKQTRVSRNSRRSLQN